MKDENEEKKRQRHHKPKPPKPPNLAPLSHREKATHHFPIQIFERKIICTDLCGDILLDHDIFDLEIWKKALNHAAIVTITIFNSTYSTSLLKIFVLRKNKSPVILNVPKGNSLSATVEDAISISVRCVEGERIEGKFCLEICFAFPENKSYFND